MRVLIIVGVVILILLAYKFIEVIYYILLFGLAVLFLPKAISDHRFHKFKKSKDNLVGIPDIAVSYWDLQSGNAYDAYVSVIVLKVFGIGKELNDILKKLELYSCRYNDSKLTPIKFLLEGYGLQVTEKNIIERDGLYELWKSLNSGRIWICQVNKYLLNDKEEFDINPTRLIYDHAIIVTAVHTIKKITYVYYTDTDVLDGSLKIVGWERFVNVASKEVLETAVIPEYKNLKRIASESELKKHIVCSCGQKLRIPFGKNLLVKCTKCLRSFEVYNDLVGYINMTAHRVHNKTNSEKTASEANSNTKWTSKNERMAGQTKASIYDEYEKNLIVACGGNKVTANRLIAYEINLSKRSLTREEAAKEALDKLLQERR